MARRHPPALRLAAALGIATSVALRPALFLAGGRSWASPGRRCALVRSGALGDEVEIEEGGVWTKATVDSERPNGAIKVKLSKEGHDYYCVPDTWRLPLGVASTPAALPVAAGKVAPKEAQKAALKVALKAEDAPKVAPKAAAAKAAPQVATRVARRLTVGEKFSGKVMKVTSTGALVDIGLPAQAYVNVRFFRSSLLNTGQQVDLWVLREEDGKPLFTMVDVWKHRSLVNQWLPATAVKVVSFGVLVDVKTPDGSSLRGLLRQQDCGPAVLKVGDELQVRLAEFSMKTGFDFTLVQQDAYLTFKRVPESHWHNGTVIAVLDRELLVNVFNKRTGAEVAGLLPFSKIVNETSLTPGKAVQVRVTGISQRRRVAKLSMITKRSADDTWLEGTVQEVTDLGLQVSVDGKKGFVLAPQIREGYIEDMSQEGFEPGQVVRVRVVGSGGSMGLHLSMRQV